VATLPDNLRIELNSATSVTDPMRVAKAFRDAADSIASWSHSKLAELQRALDLHDVTAPVRASTRARALDSERDEAQRSLEFTRYWYAFRLKRLRELADKHGLTREHCEIVANGTEDHVPPDAERLYNMLKHERDRLAEFKAYVHKRLDDAGVPADPEPAENAKHGCRIEGRLTFLLVARLELWEALDSATDQLDTFETEGAAVADLRGLLDVLTTHRPPEKRRGHGVPE
jgi:hypothetical protein